MYPARMNCSNTHLENTSSTNTCNMSGTFFRKLPELFFACCFSNLRKDDSEIDLSKYSLLVYPSSSTKSISEESFITCQSEPEDDLSVFFDIPKEQEICTLSKDLALEQLQDTYRESNELQHACRFVENILHPLSDSENIHMKSTPCDKTILNVNTSSYHYGSIQFESKIPYDIILNKNIHISIHQTENGKAVIEFPEETLLLKKVDLKKRNDMCRRVPFGKDIFLQGIDNAQSRYLNKVTFFSDQMGKPRCYIEMGTVFENTPPEEIRTKEAVINTLFQQTLSEHLKICHVNLGPREALAEKHASSGWNMALAQFGISQNRPMGGNGEVILKLFSPKLSSGKGEDGRVKWNAFT